MLYIVALLTALALFAFCAIQIYRMVQGYRKATGTPWQRFLAAFSDSLTILWARILSFSGAIATFVVSVLPQLDPQSTSGAVIAAMFTPETAKYWLGGLVVIGVVTETFRRRAGSIDPVLPPTQAKA